MLDALVFEQLRKIFTLFDRYRTYEHRLSLFVALLYLLDNGIVLALFCLEDNIGVIYSCDRLVCRHLDNIKAVDLPELVLLGERSTGHTRQLLVKSEIVLEGDSSDSL